MPTKRSINPNYSRIDSMGNPQEISGRRDLCGDIERRKGRSKKGLRKCALIFWKRRKRHPSFKALQINST